MKRVLRIKIFLGSTIEELTEEIKCFLDSNPICPGNMIEPSLTKLGNVYQFVLCYAEVIEGKEEADAFLKNSAAPPSSGMHFK